jgi:hypothetical protein
MFVEGNVPPGGTCLSSFVVASSGSKILVGKVTAPEKWISDFFVGEATAKKVAESGKYVIPARHLAWYESPLEAASSVLRDQVSVRVPEDKLRLIEVQSHLRGDPASTEKPPHWDICFVYEAKLSGAQAGKLKKPEWFGELGFKQRRELSADDFDRGHGDILEMAGVIGSSKKKR